MGHARPAAARWSPAGAPARSASAVIASGAPAAPPPTISTGRRAAASSAAASATPSGSGAGRCGRQRGAGTTAASTGSWRTSRGSDTTTGPGRPETAVRTARCSSSGIRSARRTSTAHLLIGPEGGDDVGLLEGPALDDPVGDLADQQQHRHRLVVGVLHRDRGVGGARAARHQADAEAPAAREAVGEEARHLLVAGVQVADAVVAGDRVDHLHHRRPRDAGDQIDALGGQTVDDQVGARAGRRGLLGHRSSGLERCDG